MIYILLLLMVTAVWGWTFVLVKDALTQYPTLPFLQLRFVLALLVMIVLVRHLPTRRELLVGAAVGAVLAGSYLAQTVGLTMTSPANSGLITGLFIVFTPLIDRLLGVPLRPRTVVAVGVALAGTILLAGGWSGFGWGELLTLVCAVLVALQIVLLSRWAPGLRPAPLAMVQMAACALIFSAGGSWSLSLPNGHVWVAIVITGVFASALAFYIQTWAQQHLSASRAALVLATEPGWAVVAAVVLAGQRFDLLQAAGAVLVLGAIVGHELATLESEVHGQPAAP